MTYRIRNLVLAIGLALVAMLLTLFYVSNYKRSVEQSSTDTKVWVAAKDIPAGTAGSDLGSAAFRSIAVPRRSVVPGAVSDPDQVRSLVVSAPIFAGQQVTLRNFSDVAAQGIRAQLKGNLRAIELSGSADQMLSGTLQPGDHVDVVANLRIGDNRATNATRIVLRDLTVLGEPGDGTAAHVANGQTSALLAVSDTQVQRLFYVVKNADWTLELRPVVDATDSAERIDTLETVIRQGVR